MSLIYLAHIIFQSFQYKKKQFLIPGPASIEAIAKQVVSCEGPSGPNKEYVYNLAETMRQIAPKVQDDHLFGLEACVRELDPDLKKK